jgi:hypothetical protein
LAVVGLASGVFSLSHSGQSVARAETPAVKEAAPKDAATKDAVPKDVATKDVATEDAATKDVVPKDVAAAKAGLAVSASCDYGARAIASRWWCSLWTRKAQRDVTAEAQFAVADAKARR